MKKTVLLLLVIGVFYVFISDALAKNLTIPADAIRIRIIPNSNSAFDQDIKLKVKDKLEITMYDLLKDAESSEEAEEIIKNNLELVDLLDQKKDVYIAGPSEFIDLIADCEYFVTDSFHGVVFSIIYHKRFSVICGEKRVKMRSRIESLLNEFNLDKQWDDDLKLDKTDIDYEMIDEIVEKKRNLAINYLMNDLNF